MKKRTPTPAVIGSYDAKTHLPELLRQVQEGKEFTITNRGKPVAELMPAGTRARANAVRAVEDMKSFMHSQPVRGADIKTLIEEGRR